MAPEADPNLTDPPADPNPAAASDPSAASKPERPAGLPDDYWSDKGLVADKLAADLAELPDLRKLKAEADERAAKVPAEAGDYKIELPADLAVPEGMKLEIDDTHPLAKPAREFAKKHGLSQDQFAEMVGIQAQAEIAGAAQVAEASKAEMAKLGTKAPQRLDALTNFFQARYGNEKANALLPFMFTAQQIQVLETIMGELKAGGEYRGGGKDPNAKPEISDEDYDRMSPADKLTRARQLARGEAA